MQFSLRELLTVTAVVGCWLGVFRVAPYAALSLLGVFLVALFVFLIVRSWHVYWSRIGLAIALLFVTPFFQCMCGHFSVLAFIVTVPGVVFAWQGFEGSVRYNPYALIAAVPIALLSSLAFALNIADVVWFGHNPLWLI